MTIIPNTTTIEVVGLYHCTDGSLHLIHTPIIAWALDDEAGQQEHITVVPVLSNIFAYHDTRTGMAWVENDFYGTITQLQDWATALFAKNQAIAATAASTAR
jgi:hypothetical protein